MAVKITDPRLPALVMQKIANYPDFKDVAQLARRNTSGPLYMVGGKVYRTVIELVHGYDCGAVQADWDFLCLGDVVQKHRIFTLAGWEPDISPYDYKANSLCLKYYKPSQQCSPSIYGPPINFNGPPFASHTNKIDIIGIKDVPKFGKHDNRVDDYFAAVPLTIQALALSVEQSYPTLRGADAMHSIEMRTVYINNEKGTLRPFDVNEYAMRKAESLSFKYSAINRMPRKVPCDCFDGDSKAMFWHGCQRKDIHV